MSDHDKLMTAISIVQAHILSLDSNLDGEFMFGKMHMRTTALELAANLMAEVIGRLDD